MRLVVYHNLGLDSGPNFRWQYSFCELTIKGKQESCYFPFLVKKGALGLLHIYQFTIYHAKMSLLCFMARTFKSFTPIFF